MSVTAPQRPPGPAGPPPPAPSSRAGTPAVRPPALLPAHVARLVGFVALAMLGALQWAQMVRPAAADALLACVVASAVTGALLASLARRAPPARVRVAATVGAALALLLVAFLAAGIPLRLLGPRAWDDLAGGIAQGIGAVATVSTPYSGLDEWTRIVIVLGGCTLTGLAALLAFAPRRRAAFGSPAAAAVALGVLYTVPVMQHDIHLPYLAGLLFALLLAAFLWLERIERRSAGAAATLIAVAALGGYVAAPGLDGDRALLDYEELAQSLSAATTTQYRWNHDYGPLDWPRDGREVLRVRAEHRSYWKAVNLARSTARAGCRTPARRATGWSGRIFDPRLGAAHPRDAARAAHVAVRHGGLGARHPRQPAHADAARPPASSRAPATRCAAATPTARSSTRRARRTRSCAAPAATTPACRATTASCACRRGPRHRQRPRRGGDGGRALARWRRPGDLLSVVGPARRARRRRRRPTTIATAVLADSAYGGVYALAQRLREGTSTPFEYVRAIERYLADDAFSYSETPRRSRAAAGRLPAARSGRLLPAVLRRDGAAAAHGRRAGARGQRLLAGRPGQGARRVRRARRRRALVGRVLRARHGLGRPRPDAGRLARTRPAGRPRRRRRRADRRASAAASARWGAAPTPASPTRPRPRRRTRTAARGSLLAARPDGARAGRGRAGRAPAPPAPPPSAPRPATATTSELAELRARAAAQRPRRRRRT